jgi:hypothetical protein
MGRRTRKGDGALASGGASRSSTGSDPAIPCGRVKVIASDASTVVETTQGNPWIRAGVRFQRRAVRRVFARLTAFRHQVL